MAATFFEPLFSFNHCSLSSFILKNYSLCIFFVLYLSRLDSSFCLFNVVFVSVHCSFHVPFILIRFLSTPSYVILISVIPTPQYFSASLSNVVPSLFISFVHALFYPWAACICHVTSHSYFRVSIYILQAS